MRLVFLGFLVFSLSMGCTSSSPGYVDPEDEDGGAGLREAQSQPMSIEVSELNSTLPGQGRVTITETFPETGKLQLSAGPGEPNLGFHTRLSLSPERMERLVGGERLQAEQQNWMTYDVEPQVTRVRKLRSYEMELSPEEHQVHLHLELGEASDEGEGTADGETPSTATADVRGELALVCGVVDDEHGGGIKGDAQWESEFCQQARDRFGLDPLFETLR
jgi:hypothetical protein